MATQALTRRLTGNECSKIFPPVATFRNALLQQWLQRKVDQLLSPNTPNFHGSVVVCLDNEDKPIWEVRALEWATYIVTSCSFEELAIILEENDRVVIHQSTSPMNEKWTIKQLRNSGFSLTYLSKEWNETWFYVIENGPIKRIFE